MTVRELNLKNDALDEYSTLLYDMCDETVLNDARKRYLAYHRQLFKEKMEAYNEWVAIQGECVAANVQGNKYHVVEPDLYVFNLIYPTGRVDSLEAKKIVSEYGLKFVPVIDESVSIKGMSVNEVLDYATGNSQLYNTLREGIVFRSLDGKQSFKAVSPKFLMKYDE